MLTLKKIAFFIFCFFVSAPVWAATFTVDTTNDTHDATPGDGICADGAAACSLRAAVEETTALAGTDVISLPANTYILTLGTALIVNESLTINGSSPVDTIIDGNNATQVFSVSNALTDVTLSRLTVKGGTGVNGTFLRHNGNVLTLDSVHITQNGGAEILQAYTGSLIINSSVFSTNTNSGSVLNLIIPATITNSIFFNNSSSGFPGIITSSDNVTFNNSLITGNTSVGGRAVDAALGTITFQNSILSNNTGGNCSASGGALSSGGNNIEDLNQCGFGATSNTDPLLGTLDTTSYVLPFYPLTSLSSARDAGSNATCAATDIRGVARPQGTNCDIGAFEGRLATATPSAASLAFADQQRGTSSSSQTVTLTNNGEFTLTITDTATTDEFSQSNNCGASLVAGATCTLTVTFSPTTAGAHSGTVVVSHNGSGSSTSVTLSGTALASGSVATAIPSPSSLTFTDQTIDTNSSTQAVTLTNSGTALLTISSIANTGDFSQTNDCGSSIGAGGTCTITVTFSPTTVGNHSGVLTVLHDGAGSSTLITLGGTAVAASGGGSGSTVTTQYQGAELVSCSLSAQSKTSAKAQMFLLFFALSILFLKRFASKRNILFFLFAVIFFHPFSLWAFDASFSNEIFKPTADDSDYFTVYSSPVLKKSQYHFGMLFDYFHNPIQLGNSGNFSSISPINSNVILGHAFGSYSPLNRLSVGGSIPFYLQNSIQLGGTDTSHMDLGDFELFVKYNLLNRKKSKGGAKIGISIQAEGLIPTATNPREHFTGSGSFGGGATVIVDSQVHSRVNLALNAGAEIKSSFTNIDGNKYGSQIKLGAAVAYDLIPKKLKLIAENQVDSQLDNLFKRVSSPMEARLGLRYRFKQGVNLNLGGGMGYRAALASPDYRIFAGATFTSHRSDEFVLPEAVVDEFMLDEKEWSELQLGDELKLKDKIFFDYNQSAIRPISKPTLSKLALFLKKHDEFKKLRVEGHTCDIGGKAYNLKLSQKRAEEVTNYLVEQGVEASRLSSVGKGMEDPIVPNSDDYSREQNRRVSIFVEEKQ